MNTDEHGWNRHKKAQRTRIGLWGNSVSWHGVAMVSHPTARWPHKTFEPGVIIERFIHVERLKKFRVHIQRPGGLFHIGHGIWVEISASTLGCAARNNS